MKKSLIITVLATFMTWSISAQLKIYEKSLKSTQTLKSIPAPTPAPAPKQENDVQKTASNLPIYRITSVRINILTGSDNKEFPSKVSFSLYQKNYDVNKGDVWDNFSLFEVRELKNEMKINSNTEMGQTNFNNYTI